MLVPILKGTSMLKRLLVLAALLCGCPSLASAQDYLANVQVTIDDSVTGVGFAAGAINGAGHPAVNSASCTSNSSGGDFRYRVDGTAPTTSNGVLVPAGGNVVFVDSLALLTFRGVRTASTSAVLSCTLSSDNTPPVYPVGGGGAGGGGGSGCVGTAGTPCIVAGNDAAGVPTAGTVLAVQGIASMTPVQVSQATAASLNAQVVGAVASGASDSGNPVKVGGRYNSTPIVLTNGQRGDLQMTPAGAVLVAPSQTGTFAQDSTYNTTLLTTGPSILYRAEATTPSTATDNLPVYPMADLIGRAFTVQGANDNATQAGTPIAIVTTASTNATNIKSTPGVLHNVHLVNTTATIYYLRFYNLGSTPTCSSATGFLYTLPIPASLSGAGVVVDVNVGIAFTTGIGYCITAGPTSTDNVNAGVGIYGAAVYK